MLERVPPSKRFIGYILFSLFLLGGIFVGFFSGISVLNNKKYVIYFNRSINGLKIGSYVYYKGVPVGVVQSVSINLPEGNSIKVIIKVDKNVPIYKGCVAKIGAQGLISGNYVLDLFNNPKEKELLESSIGSLPEIKSEYSVIENLLDNFPDLLLSMTNLIKEISDVVDKNKTSVNSGFNKIGKLISNINSIASGLDESVQTINATSLPLIEESLKNVIDLSKLIKLNLNKLPKDFVPLIESFLIDLQVLSNKLKNSMASGSNSKLGWMVS